MIKVQENLVIAVIHSLTTKKTNILISSIQHIFRKKQSLLLCIIVLIYLIKIKTYK